MGDAAPGAQNKRGGEIKRSAIRVWGQRERERGRGGETETAGERERERGCCAAMAK